MADPTERGFALARSSSRGPTLDGRIKPDVSAPGVNVTSARSGTTTGYIAYSGTSMAAPFTAGVVLLMLAVNPSLTPAQVRDAIASSAVDWGLGGDGKTAGSRGVDNEYGHGRLDAYAAIQSAGAAVSNPPVAPAHSLFEGTLSDTGATVDHVFNVTSLEFPIAATLIQPKISGGTASRPDFDIYLYNPAGTQVAKGATQYRQDSLSHVPKVVGQYRLRVRSYRGKGGYFVDASYGATTAATPTPSPTPTPAPTAPTTVTAKPAGVAVLQGSYRKGNAASLAKNDGIYYVVDSTASGTRVAAWYGSFSNVARDLSSLSITYRGSNTLSATQTVSIYRWTDSSWVVLNSRTVGRTEIKIANLSPPGNPANYVSGSGASGEVRVRIRSVLNTSFRSRGDVMKIVYTSP
jgi:hypothetical protein